MADGWISSLLGIHRLKKSDNSVLPQRSTLKVIGATLTDDPTNKQSVLDISAGVNGTVTVRKNSGADVGTRGRLNLIEGSGVAITAADDAGSGEVDITIAATGATPTLQQAYTAGGTIDAEVASGTNNLRVRAADALTDILLFFRRKVTSEQTLLKAPDAVATAIEGTDLVLASGAGKAGTGATNGSDGGLVVLSASAGGSAVNGQAGGGGNAYVLAGAGGGASGTGDGRAGGNARLWGAAGGVAAGAGVGGDGGSADIRAGNGASTAAGTAGNGGPLALKSGDGGDASSATGQPGSAGAINVTGGAGGDSNDAGINGGGGGDINIEAGPGGTNVPLGGESGLGSNGAISIGPAVARGIVVGYLGILEGVGVAGVKIYSGVVTPVGNVTGNPGDLYFRQATTNSGLWEHRGSSANNTSWVKLDPASGTYLPLAGGTLTGPIKTTQTNVAFSTTPSFDVAANDDFALGTLTNNIAITLANPAVGQSGTIAFLQDGTGSRRITAITVSGFTVRCLNAGGLVNTTEFKAANARSVLFYKMVTINSVNLCLVQIAGDGAVSPDFT
jgi:hypothetical protein